MAPVSLDLEEAVARVRDRVAVLVAADGADAHQVAANHLAWTVARAEAAMACRRWAGASGDPLADLIAGAAEEEALAFAEGRATELGALDAGRLVAIHAGH